MTQEVAAFLDDINELLDNEKYAFAFETLRGISATVRRMDVVTEGQRRAVDNITHGVRDGLPSARFRGSRRYENWEPEKK